MMRATIAVALLVTGADLANAKPAWDISAKWLCVETQRISCNQTQGCEKGSARAVSEVDFEAMTVTNFTGGTSAIGVKRYSPSISSQDVPESYFATGGGQMSVIVDRPLTGIGQDGSGYPVQSVTLWGSDKANLYYGECRPR